MLVFGSLALGYSLRPKHKTFDLKERKKKSLNSDNLSRKILTIKIRILIIITVIPLKTTFWSVKLAFNQILPSFGILKTTH